MEKLKPLRKLKVNLSQAVVKLQCIRGDLEALGTLCGQEHPDFLFRAPEDFG